MVKTIEKGARKCAQRRPPSQKRAELVEKNEENKMGTKVCPNTAQQPSQMCPFPPDCIFLIFLFDTFSRQTPMGRPGRSHLNISGYFFQLSFFSRSADWEEHASRRALRPPPLIIKTRRGETDPCESSWLFFHTLHTPRSLTKVDPKKIDPKK